MAEQWDEGNGKRDVDGEYDMKSVVSDGKLVVNNVREKAI